MPAGRTLARKLDGPLGTMAPGGRCASSRLLKKVHLPGTHPFGWVPTSGGCPARLRTRCGVPEVRPTQRRVPIRRMGDAALHLGLFEQPDGKGAFQLLRDPLDD